jgi:predicted nucleotidyltransferase
MASELDIDSEFYGVRTIDSVIGAVKRYADEVRQSFPVVKAYLFGSWAKGTATKFSDVDVCFFLENYGNKPKRDIITDLFHLRRKYISLGIEPHALQAFHLDDDHPFVREILETGIEI